MIKYSKVDFHRAKKNINKLDKVMEQYNKDVIVAYLFSQLARMRLLLLAI